MSTNTKTPENWVVEADEHGIYNGIKLAAHAIAEARRLLMPYAGYDPLVCRKLLTGVSIDVIANVENAECENGQMCARVASSLGGNAKGDDLDAALEKHLLSQAELVAELLALVDWVGDAPDRRRVH